MASINFAFRNQSVANGKFSGDIEVSGDDFSGNSYKQSQHVEFDAAKEWDIPVGPCSVHVSVWMATPTQACVDGHLQCGPARQPTNGPFCVNA